jgi:hypothetical protein
MDLHDALARMEATLQNAQAELLTELGGERTSASARVWQGRVLVDWELDDQAGGCLLRPPLVRRLVALHAATEVRDGEVKLRAAGHIVARLSTYHADLVERLGSPNRVELWTTLRFNAQDYLGGEEAYTLVKRPLLRVIAAVRRARPASPQMPRARL